MDPQGGLSAAEFSRWFLAGFFLFVALFYTLRICATSSRSGTSPVVPGSVGGRHRLHHNVFGVFRAAILVVCLVRAFFPGIDPLLVPFAGLWHPVVLIGGTLLLTLGFLGALYVHFFMGADWRSGIDASGGQALITRGPFAISRNPMYVMIQLSQLGLFLALPSVFTLVCLIVGSFVLHAQVRLEEAHLAEAHGGAYAAYRDRVPRWLGHLPKRSAARQD